MNINLNEGDRPLPSVTLRPPRAPHVVNGQSPITTSGSYVPALRFHGLTGLYDALLRFTLREEGFKRRLIEQAALAPGMRVLDLGCGTATLSLLIKRIHPDVEVTGLDADARALDIARRKGASAGLDLRFQQGFLQDPPLEPGSFDRILSSLVFHHLGRADKLRAFEKARQLLKPGGTLHVADWGRAQNLLMRAAFLSVQCLDGFGPTSDNVRGLLPELMAEAGFKGVSQTHAEGTVYGTLAFYRAVRD